MNLNTNVKQGPYSIEVGINTQTVPAPLLVPIVGSEPPANPETASVPLNGWIEFSLDSPIPSLGIAASAFPSIPNPVGRAPPALPANRQPGGSTVFTLSSTQGVAGNGTVKIRS